MKQYRKPDKLRALLQRIYYSPKLKNLRTRYYYARYHNKNMERIRQQKQIHILFFIQNIGMWKYESLVKILLQDERFKVSIMPFPYPWHTKEQQHTFQNAIIEYCKKHEFPLSIGFDIDTQKYIPANKLNADIVVYTQHYNGGYVFWKLEKFWKHSIFFTTPYGIPIDDNPVFNNTLLQNVSWKIFYPTAMSEHVYKSNPITHGKNFMVVGNPIFDSIMKENRSCDNWKIPGPGLKRVIWAPHHSISPDDLLPFSTFLTVCHDMVTLAKRYSDRVQFVFKPHPYLYERLVKIWGKQETDRYYDEWRNMPNSAVALGDYHDLFFTSDAMIHDCASFSLEYLFTKKPVLYLSKSGHERYLSGYSLECYNMHYKGEVIRDVEKFITDVVLDGNDSMQARRNEFYDRELLPPNNRTVAENMYEAIKHDLLAD